MTASRNKIWFPAKRYGWGWGPPVCWQGWVVMLAIVGLIVGGAVFVAWKREAAPYFPLYAIGLSLVMVLICWAKGEKPRWRWGEKGDDDSEGG